MKILVCGGRDFNDMGFASTFLDGINAISPIEMVIYGGAPGADMLGKFWAERTGIHSARVEAQWQRYGKSAGPKRNAAMLLLKPDLVVAFPGGVGTADMVRRAKGASIPVREATP